MTNLCNLNGSILPEEKTHIPVLDRGFLFGDSIYEVMGTSGGVPFAFPEHLERMHASADSLLMSLDVDDRTLLSRIKQTIAAAGNAESYVRIIITRGVGTAPNIDVAYSPGPCTVLVLVRPLPKQALATGSLAIVTRLRNDSRALDPASKTGNYLNNVLGLIEAKRLGATDALFTNAAGYLTEATTSNLWMVEKGNLFTPPLTAGILAGVSRRLLLECCREAGIRCEERDITRQHLLHADEVFTSSTLRHLFPVTAVDGQQIGDGKPGPLTRAVSERFEQFCQRRHDQVYTPAWSRF